VPGSEFIGETIDVEHAPASPRPVRFVLKGQTHTVAQVLAERVDTGHGDAPPRSRRWFTRRHRRYFVVRDDEGGLFEMYLDYSDKQHLKWFMTRRLARFP